MQHAQMKPLTGFVQHSLTNGFLVTGQCHRMTWAFCLFEMR